MTWSTTFAAKTRSSDIDRRYGLEPVIEPGRDAGSDALEQFRELSCPYCAEIILVRVDLSAGPQSCVEDCQVCCQPMLLTVRVSDDGRLIEVSAARADDQG